MQNEEEVVKTLDIATISSDISVIEKRCRFRFLLSLIALMIDDGSFLCLAFGATVCSCRKIIKKKKRRGRKEEEEKKKKKRRGKR